LYKEYIIFLKTRDDSLVQVSGTNIFVYLNDKLGRLQAAFYDEKRTKNAGAADGAQQPIEGNDGAFGLQPDGATGMQLPAARQIQRKNIGSNKYNVKNERDEYVNNLGKNYWDDIVNRNRLFYCTHMNRKNAFFQKHVLNSKIPQRQIAFKIFQEIFGFTRMRKTVREHMIKMLTTIVHR
jgi:hypothetical protein